MNEEQMQGLTDWILEEKQAGKTDLEIKNQLVEKGVEPTAASDLIEKINQRIAQRVQQEVGDDDEGGGFPSWIIYILLLLGINLLSYIFDWSFWIY